MLAKEPRPVQQGLSGSLREWILLAGFLAVAVAGTAVLWFLGYGAFEYIPVIIPDF
ncbi:hypothetical protein BH24ACT22_BH24ACT22_01270 [soil metagenome]